jgi:alkylated DNA repair protein alkB family protein 1
VLLFCRDVEPTALLLRSGDIVVMGQEARACFHGVPRVLTENPLAADLLKAAEQAGDEYQSYLQHMQGSRVNISVRSTQ